MQIRSFHFIVAIVAGWLGRQQAAVIEYLKEENKVLREQLGNKRIPFTDSQRRRLARKGKVVGRRGLGELGCIVTPDTILRWYRQLVAQKYDGSNRRGPGRPRTASELRALVVAIAIDNPSWGYTRISDVLRSLGRDIGRTTIQVILKEQGIEPAPKRKRGMSWNEFLRAHWGAIAACDFFTVEVLTLHGLFRYHVFFVIDLASRRVEIGGIVHEPTGAWMMQVARNLLDAEDGFLVGKTHLIMDRDPVFTADVRDFLEGAGVQVVRLPARSPNLNAYAERFVLSIKSECLDKLILLGEGHLRLAVREYVAHYNSERPHQGLGGLFVETPANENEAGSIQCSERLGGLLRFYRRQAA
jgi:transposase InsO family protein